MDQQRPSVAVYGTTNPPNATFVQTVGQPQSTVQVQRKVELRYLPSHKVLGVIQMMVGILCLLLGIVGLVFLNAAYVFYGTGIYTGIVFFVTGLLGCLGGRLNSRCLIISCMVMNIIGSAVAVVGISMAAIELSFNTYRNERTPAGYYQIAKDGVVIAACIFEFVVTIVHAGFTCATSCPCCLPRQVDYRQAPATGQVVVQVSPTGVPTGQVYQYQTHMPQQQYVTQQQQAQIYSQHGYIHNAYPQQGQSMNQGVNTVFAHDQEGGASGVVLPPPYSKADPQQ